MMAGLAILFLMLLARRFATPVYYRSDLSSLLAGAYQRCTDAASMRLYLLVVWIIGVVFLPFIISRLLTSFYRPRYTMSASIPFYLLLSFAIFELHKVVVARLVIALLLGVYVYDAYSYYSEQNKERWREATRHVEAAASPNALVVIKGGELLHTNYSYYSRRGDLLAVPFVDKATHFGGDVAAFERHLDQLIAEHDRIWVVLCHRDAYTDRLLAKFEEPWRLLDSRKYFSRSHVARTPYLGIEVLRYER